MLLLKEETYTRVFDICKIQNISSTELKVEWNKEKDFKTLEVSYFGGGLCKFMYLSFGLVWIPSYKLILDKDNRKFNLKLSATFISNEEVDLGVVKNVNCVVGVPNMS